MSISALALWLCATVVSQANPEPAKVTVGSKKFTESVIVGEMVTLLARKSGADVDHRAELGGTRLLFNALSDGEIDIYPEYTGTISQEIYAGRDLRMEEAIREALLDEGIRMSRPLGFSNSYVLGMEKDRSQALAIRTISDLRDHPQLRLGFTNEFMDRAEGWPALRRRYGLPHKNVRGLDHDIAYRALENGAIDVTDLYSTDAEIQYYDLALLEDDREHFPLYYAVLLYRKDLEERAPGVVHRILQLEGTISESRMIALNKRAKIDKVGESEVAGDFLAKAMDLEIRVESANFFSSLWRTTRDHLMLVAVSMLGAILVSIPLGIWAAKRRRMAQGILGVVGIIQTIPALALLVLLMAALQPLQRLGVQTLGAPPAIAALFLYSLLPIVRNTYTGLHDIPAHIRESAAALGLSPAARLRLVELPIASRTILAGIKTATVINIGFATLGALIGAGGYGQPILTGIRLDDTELILQGAIPAALLALAAQGFFELAERVIVPTGLRLKSTHL